jgi:hypothetical protein
MSSLNQKSDLMRINMKTNKFVRGLSVTILVSFFGGGVAYANNALPASHQILSQNARQKMPHSKRKEAAARLKGDYVQQRENQLLEIAHAHRGYTGQGQAGGGK